MSIILAVNKTALAGGLGRRKYRIGGVMELKDAVDAC